MIQLKNGGPAFPLASPGGTIYEGMTLRDYFAAKALAGMLADPNVKLASEDMIKGAALLSYKMADAMLAERAK